MQQQTLDMVPLVSTILEQSCGVDPQLLAQQEDAPLLDLGLDSLAVLELQAKVADEHGVDLPDDIAHHSVREIAAMVEAGR